MMMIILAPSPPGLGRFARRRTPQPGGGPGDAVCGGGGTEAHGPALTASLPPSLPPSLPNLVFIEPCSNYLKP